MMEILSDIYLFIIHYCFFRSFPFLYFVSIYLQTFLGNTGCYALKDIKEEHYLFKRKQPCTVPYGERDIDILVGLLDNLSIELELIEIFSLNFIEKGSISEHK